MASKYDLQNIPDIVSITNDWNDRHKIAREQNGYEDEKKSKVVDGQICGKWNNERQKDESKRSNIRREKKDNEGSSKDKKRLGFENNANIGNAFIRNQKFKYNKNLDRIEWVVNVFEISAMLKNVQRKCPSTLSSFQMLANTFQQYHTHCCNAFRTYQNDSTAEEALEHCAATTYAIIRLLFHIGYNPERITVSGLDILMLLAAKDVMKLENACFAWKTIASLMRDSDGPEIVEQINAILLKLDINSEKTNSLINIERLTLSSAESLTVAILTNEGQNVQFLNSQMESFMIFGSSNNNSTVKHIEKFGDFIAFIISQKDSKLLKTLRKTLIAEGNISKFLTLKSQLQPWKQSLNQNVAEISNFQVNFRVEKYLFAHSIYNCNILSAATLLTTICGSLSNKKSILEDATFLFPVTFASENEIINFKVRISDELCTVTYSNYQCVTFRLGESCPGMHSGASNNWKGQDSYRSTHKFGTIPGNNRKSIAEEEFYTEMEQYHYQYNKEFRCVRKLVINKGSGTVELTPSAHLDVLIDGAMQAIVFIYNQQYSNKLVTLVPFHFRKVEIISITERETISIEKCEDANNIFAFVKAELQNGKLLGSFEFITNGIAVAAHSISFHPMTPDNMMRLFGKERVLSSNLSKSLINSRRQASLEPEMEKSTNKNELSQIPLNRLIFQDKRLIGIKSFACRLPRTVHDPAEFWDALKTGQIMASKIPCSRISGRDNLAQGQYGHSVRCANFLANDISYFDAAFFGISRSEAEKIDPQQRILLECVYECMENAGLTSLRDAGFFVGFMSNEYPDIVKNRDAISMLGASASVVSGRLNHLFGSTGPAITLDTACSSSLVALQAAIHALRDGHCAIAIVAGVNLILTEESIGQRANGNLLADDGMCRSFDARSSGYGRADGCVALLLTIANKAVEEKAYAASVISTRIGHNGQSISLTAPSGRAQEKLLLDCLSKLQGNQSIEYWETHGTGTIIGDAIELKALQANLRDCLISTVKTHFGHSEAAAGAAGLAKILLQFKYEYIPEHGSYQFLQNLRDGSLYLPAIGEEWTGDVIAGISSFGISGTNAMAILQSEKSILKRSNKRITRNRLVYICPVSAKSKESLDMLMINYQTMLENTSQNIEDICSTAAIQRNHMQYRAVIVLRKGKIMQKWLNYEKSEKQEMIGLKLCSNSYLRIFPWFYLTFSKFRMNFKIYFPLMNNFVTQQISAKFQRTQSAIILACFLGLITFLYDAGVKVEAIHAYDNLSLTAALLITGGLKFSKINNVLYSNIQIFTRKISIVNTCIDNYEWYKLCTTKDGKTFEYKLMEMIGRSYLRGDCINWTNLYSSPIHPITLPNYQFKRESYWITESSSTIDHWLIGRLIKNEEDECTFINQISKITNAKLMTIKYGGQMRLSFGICCEAAIQALQLSFLNNTTDQSRYYFFKDITMIKYRVQENDWIKTTVIKYTDEKYHVKLTCVSNIICEANIILTAYIIPRKTLNVTQRGSFISKPNFYETLNDKGILYETIYQAITRTSSNEKIFVAKCQCKIFLLLEAIIQAACYLDLLDPCDIYGDKKFAFENLDFHTFLSESAYIWIENRKIVVYNGSRNEMMISACLGKKRVNEEFGRTKCQEKKNAIKSHQFKSFCATTYQECADKVRQAVEDIRKDDKPLSDQQLSKSFIELGLDSLSITDLANRLNTIYFPDLQISSIDLFNYPNIFSLTDAIYNRKFSCGSVDNRRQMMHKHFDIINALAEPTRRRTRSQHKQSLSTMNEDDSCAYAQIFLKDQSRSDFMTFIVTDKQLISGRKSNNELVIIVTMKKQKCRSAEDDGAGIIYLNIRNPVNFKCCFSSHLNDHKTVMIRFELSRNFPLRYLAEVLLQLTEAIIHSRHTYVFSSKPGFGSANAFALGFAKSLSAEFYPKVQYEWNFVLQKISNLTNYTEELAKSLRTDGDNSKERWLITGGLGGIGWQMAKFIVYNRKVSHLFLLGRKQPSEMQSEEMSKMRASVGVDVCAVSVDLTSKMQMQEFFEKLQISLTSIIHSAGCVHDALASNQNILTFRLVTEAKCDGLLILEKLCRSHPIKHFIVNSSISAIIGNIGQCNYSAANAFIDEIMLERRTKGLPATIINWGNWLEIGMAVKANKILNKMGFIGLKTRQAVSYLQIAIDYAPARMIVTQLEVQKILHYRPDLAVVFPNTANGSNTQMTRGSFPEQVRNQNCQLYADQSTSDSPKQWSKSLAESGRINENGINRLKLVIVKILEEITGKAVSTEDHQKSFMDLGLDSLKIYQFVNELTKKVKVKSTTLNVLAIFEHPTIDQLSHYIESLLFSIEEHSEMIANGYNVQSKQHDRNLENIAENFAFFVSHSKDERKLKDEIFHFLSPFDQSSRIPDRSLGNDQCDGYIHVIWGSKYKILRNHLPHFEIISNIKQHRKPTISFMVSGQGSQVCNMGRQLSCIFPFFREKFDETLAVATRCMSKRFVSLRDVIYRWSHHELLYRTEYAQPIIYCFAYSLAKFYEFCGVEANFFVGHSIGEIVACTLAGRISLDDALNLVIRRGEILEMTRGKGKMIAVRENDAQMLERYSGMSRAAENSHKQIILSGDNRSAKLCLHYARLHQCPVTVIDECYPFHSSAIDQTLLDQYAMECRKVKLQKTKTRNIISNYTGKFMERKRGSIASIKSTVFFKRCVETLHQCNTNIWLEIGNGEILTTLVRSMLGATTDTLICSAIRNDMQEVDSFIHSLCQLQSFGVSIKWERICNRINSSGLQEAMKSCAKKVEKKLIIENDMELIEEHFINNEIVLPAAFIIAAFVEFAKNSLETCSDKLNDERVFFEHEMIIFEALRLEKRVRENDLSKVEVKFDSSELVLTDSINRYSSCQLGNAKRKMILEQMKQINALNELRIVYEQFKVEMNELPHQAFYETMRKRGLQYGPKYQILREICYKGYCIRATLINANDLTRLLDGALQLLSAALLNTSKSSVYVPFAINDIVIKYNTGIIHNYFHAYGIISERIGNIIKGSVVIYENDNEIIILHNVIAIDISADKSITSIKHRIPSDSQYLIDPKMKHRAVNDKSDLNSNNADNVSATAEIKKDGKVAVGSETLQIEIVSYVGQFPGSAIDCASLWNNLKAGVSLHSSGNIQKFQTDITTFDPAQFGITPREAAYIDPQQRILLEMAQKTMEKAGLKRLDSGTGVFIGVSSSDFAQKAYSEIKDICSYLSTGTNQSSLAGRIAYWFNLKGPTMVIDTACSSFFAALVVACDNIRMGNCRAALVGAINIILNSKPTSILEKAQMLSKTGFCKVFDADADGYVRSEGAAMILIQGVSERNCNLGNEMSAIYRSNMKFTIESYSIGHNGRSNALTVPNGISEYELINRATAKCLNIPMISWVEAHAAGTPLGDPIETKAIVTALADASRTDRPVYITSVKSSVGHCEAAAGAASLIMVLEAYYHHYLPPVQHFKMLNTNIMNDAALIVPVIGEELPDTFNVLINSFGFSGTNVSVILRGCNKGQLEENAKTPDYPVMKQRLSTGYYPCILLCSADDSESFELVREKLARYLEETSHSLLKVCTCLQNLRSTGRFQTAIPIKRHTQKWMSFRMINEPQKWTKIVFSLGRSPELLMITELCNVYRFFRKIFLNNIKTYKCANNFTSSKRSRNFAFEYISKLSLITFLLTIGINPSTIIAPTRIDQIVVQVVRRKYKKGIPNQRCNFEIRQKAVLGDFDCILNVQTLRIEKAETVCETNRKRSFTSQFVDTICELYEHFIDINWQVLSDRKTIETCLIPDPEYCKKKYWPFTDCNLENIDSNFSFGEVPFSNLQPETPETAKKLDEVSSVVDAINSNNFEDTEVDSSNRHYLYKLIQEKSVPPNPERIIPFIAINLTDPTTIIGQQAVLIDKINDSDGIARVKEQVDLHKCTKLVLEWISDEENLLENTVKQSILVINLWKILVNNNNSYRNKNMKLCLIVFAINDNTKRNQRRLFQPFSALLKTLAMEQTKVNFKCIHTDIIDQQFFDEISDENFLNEIIYHKNGDRYVERLQEIDESPKLTIQQIRNIDRILITGSIRGIAIELIESLKPHLAVVVSRNTPDSCSSNDSSSSVIRTVQADCTNYAQMEEIFATFAPFDIVFHSAATINNSLMENMNLNLFEMVCHPKVVGLQNIIQLSRIYPIRKIVAFSSAATILGSAGQANYVVANELVEYLMRRDVPDGLCISWGPWNGRGLLVGEHMARIRKQIQNSGWKLMQAKQVAQLCCKLLPSTGHHIAMSANFEVLRKKRPYLRNFLKYIPNGNIHENDSILQNDLPSDSKSGKDFNEIIKKCITEVGGITDVKPDIGFMSMGIDSLMIAEMLALLNKRLNLNIPIAILYEYSTVETLSQYLAQNIYVSCKLENDTITGNVNDKVAIIGYSGAFSGASDDETFWHSLLDGKELIEQHERAVGGNTEIIEAAGTIPDIDKFDYRFWKMSPDDASYIDPQIRKFVEHAYVALERSGIVRVRSKLRVAVVAGAEPSEYRAESRRIGGIEDLYEMNQKDFVAAWTSHLLDLHGPAFAVYSACSTALVAIIQAINLLQKNQCDVALAGAVSLTIPHADNKSSSQGMVLSTDGHCRPFDHKSSGTVRGSAVGVVVLRRLSEAQQINTSVIAKIAGYGITNDGLLKSSFMAPNISGQRTCIKEAIEMTGTAEVDYIECHGTGTTTGDLIELTAMSQLYDRDTLIGSVKANIGHALAGAGIAAIIKLCKIAEMRIIPTQINFDKLNENLKDVSFKVSKCNIKLQKEKLRLAVNSSGIGGTNAHIILESDNYLSSINQSIIEQPFYALTISGRTENACIHLCHRIANYLKSEMNLTRIASTLQSYREHFDYRLAISTQSAMDAVNQLRSINKVEKVIGLKRANVAFYFAPQGLEYANMGLEAMAHNEVFREVMEGCCQIASKLIGSNFQTIIHPKQKFNTQYAITEQPYSQMATFIVCFALAEQLRAWGIEGCAMIGHSLGEYVAAAQADVFDVKTALKILFKRGCLIAKTEKAKVLAVKCSNFPLVLPVKNTNDGKDLKITETVEVSAILGTDLKCLVGKPERIDKLKKQLEEDEIHCRELVTNYGFHSSFMDCILEEFAQFLENFTFRKPTKQILSNINGQLINHFDSEYMVKHMRSTIRIDKCIENLSDEIKVVIEIGSKGILESLLKNNRDEIEVISTLPSKKQYEKNYDTGDLLGVATKLWMKGYELNWEKICGNYGFDRLLPNYQFEKDVCWQYQGRKWNAERRDVNLYEPCWVPCKLTTRRRLPKGVLLFVPKISTKAVDALLIMLHNLFIPVQCIFSDALSTGNINSTNDKIYINSNKEESYHHLANFLRNTNFYYDTVIHAWNFSMSYESGRINDSYLLPSFYSIYWILTSIMQNAKTDLRFLVIIDWNAIPEIFTVLGPIRELTMTRQFVQAACLLCTLEVNLFEALQLFESYQTDFSLIRNLIDGEFEYFSYQLKSFESDNYFTKNWNGSIDWNDCLIRSSDVVVIFGFGNISQSFINVLCQNFDFLTICIASPNATCHFEKLRIKINRWKSSRKFKISGKTDDTQEEHIIRAYDVDITKEDHVRHFLNELMLQYGRINIIIHAAAGKAASIKFAKSFDQMQFVLQPKIRGIRNVIDILYENNITIRSFILNSSMNALFGLPGNSDYAASNIFLDSCCRGNFRNIENITSVQWSGWKDSNMLNTYNGNRSQNPVANLIIEHSLLVQEAERMIWKCLHERGLIAVSFSSPNDIVHEIRKLNFNTNGKFVTVPEQKESVKRNCDDLRNIIAKIWMNYLGVEQITCHDDFFQLGGHSLNGMQIIWEINRVMEIDCKLDDLFQNSQFENFLQFLQRLDVNRNDKKFRHNLESSKILDNTDNLKKIPLSYPQENIYILRHLQHPTLYNISFLLTFQGILCIKSLRKALLFLIARQTSLRTAFPVSSNGCYQEIQSLTESYYHITWPNMNEFELRQLIKEEKGHVMDLSKIPFRILAMCNSKDDREENEYMIMISQHHIITDGWSMTIFANELGRFYRYCLTNKRIPETFKRLTRNVTHFAIWQRSNEVTKIVENDLQRLCAKLHGLQATRIVAQKTAIIRSKLISHKTLSMPALLWAQINRTAKQYQQTVYTIMLAAFLCLIRKFSDDYGNGTIVIGCPVTGRIGAEEMKSVMGYFLNDIILIVKDFKMNSAKNVLFEQVKEAIQEARSFEHLPFHLVVAKLSHQRRHIQQHPIFDIFFNYRHNLDFPKIKIPDVKSTITQLSTNDAFNFACTIDETDGGTLITIDYNVNQYSVQLIDEMITEYFKLLKSISSQCDDTRSVVNVLECKSHQDVLSRSVIDIIVQQSMLTDKLAAFCLSSQTITYGQMYAMVHKFSRKIEQFYLQNNCENIRVDTVIPICADSNAIIVPLLAVQLTGATYAPIDPTNSATIIMQLVQQIGASVIIVQENNLGLNIPALQLTHFPLLYCHRQLRIDELIEWKTDHLNENLKRANNRKRLQSSDAAYIIFTSGSTGKPKAVCVSNQNLLNFVLASTQQATFHPKFRVYHTVNTIFDVSCVNIFTTFSNGCCLIASENILNSTVEIVQRNVNFAFLPSALFNMLDSDEIVQLQQLNELYVGGETPNSEQLQRCLQMGIRICQIYGPTETTIWSLSNNCSVLEHECGRVIGTPMTNENAYLLDQGNNLTCNGSKGELVIYGEGVSRGYFNQKAKNIFTFNKFHTKEDRILNRNMFCYHTGDFAMKLAGKYHFLGRKDEQLKVRGYRVEPAEIEIVIRQWDSSIRNVTILKNDQFDSLFVFIEKDMDNEYCRRLGQYLKEHLLHFMIPEKIITLQRMPLNASGKIDISKLKEMMQMQNNHSTDKGNTMSEFCQFNEVLSGQIQRIWCQILGISNCKFEDDFFVMGGHSLLVVLLRHQLRDKFKFELNIEHFYRQPTLAALINGINANTNACNEITNKKISNHNTGQDEMTLRSSPLTNSIPIMKSIKFVNLRETNSGIGNLYMIHAIAGTIYPYFGFLQAIPQCLNIYAIEYEFHYPSNSLMELASFYSIQIVRHSQMKAIHLMGHSLGGILAREIAQLLNDSGDNKITFVIMLDSWYIGIGDLHVDNVKRYLQNILKGLPGKEEYIKKSVKLTRILQNHQFSTSSIKIYLLKAKNSGNSPLRASLRSKSEEQTRSLISNGWQKISAKNVDIFLVDGDHDSMLQQHNLTFLSRIFAYIYAKNGVMVEQPWTIPHFFSQ